MDNGYPNCDKERPRTANNKRWTMRRRDGSISLSLTISNYLGTKPGGLDVETNRDRDRERPSCRD